MDSPFEDEPKAEWRDIRDELIKSHPLSTEDVKNLVLESFDNLLETRVGSPSDGLKLFQDIELSSQVQSDFLETILARNLIENDDSWRHGSEAEKDFIYTEDPFFSTELKASGQEGVTEVFGNRSYAQKVETENAKKSKTGFYITVNFYRESIYLIRFGWIDFSDWTGQSAASGQAATLSDEAYMYKLKTINGSYRLDAPVTVLSGVGPGTKEEILQYLDMKDNVSVREFIEGYESSEEEVSNRVRKAYETAKEYEEAIRQE